MSPSYFGDGDLAVEQGRQDQQQAPPPVAEWIKRCPTCEGIPQKVRSFLDPIGGKTIRLMECKCGERIWSS
jgi:hypothetical protein